MKTNNLFALLLAASFLSSSCFTTKTQKTAASLSTVSQSANFADLNKTTSTILSNKKRTDNHLLANMEGGLAAYHLKDYDKALELLTKADDELTARYFKADVDIKKSFKDYFNRTARGPYLGNMHEKFNISGYALLCCLGMNDMDQARVWANRIVESSEIAQELHLKREDEIAKYKKASDKARQEKKDKIRNFYSKLAEVEVYPEFINPFALGLAAILKLSDSNDANGAEESMSILREITLKTDYEWTKLLIAKLEESIQTGTKLNLKILIISGGTIKSKKIYEWKKIMPSGHEKVDKWHTIADLDDGKAFPNYDGNFNLNTMCENDFLAIDSFLKANESFAGKLHISALQLGQKMDNFTRKFNKGPEGQNQLLGGIFDASINMADSLAEPGKKFNAADLRGWNSLPKEHRIAFIQGDADLPELNVEGKEIKLEGNATGMEIIHIRSTQSKNIVHRFSLN